jgi:hypothetical protein
MLESPSFFNSRASTRFDMLWIITAINN